MASSKVSTGNGSVSGSPAAEKMAAMSPSTSSRISAASMNDISTSICVCSGWRSARRSSSRKQRAIW